jgi:hypothetical protein
MTDITADDAAIQAYMAEFDRVRLEGHGLDVAALAATKAGDKARVARQQNIDGNANRNKPHVVPGMP